MRVLLFVVEAAVVVGVGWVIYLLVRPRGSRELESAADWEVHTESGGGVTTVVVRQIAPGARGGPAELGRQVVGTVPDDAQDWDGAYHLLMAEARSRVAALRSQSE
ncbi:hypothetical protein ACRYCC_01860 [Actinomadura scrupuli]|uniref:hypothetical protein n=1 Tax=Actinomadura scrupuli TaxID=559629 RepID=UPI003D96D4E1